MKTPPAIVLFLLCLAIGGCSVPSASNSPADVSETPAASPTAAAPPAAENDNSRSPQDENADDNTRPTLFTGTAGITDKKFEIAGAALLVDVRAARHPEFDRIVFEFRGDLPSYHIEYIDKPVRQCGSGNAAAIAGDAWLQMRFSPANAHDERGESTVPMSRSKPDLTVVKEVAATCDFEAEVEWVAGVAKPNKYRVTELNNPTRLAVDIQH
ncbi:MAG: hypothetical protein ABI791_13505 [Acidobacteriota bacterium]